MGYADKCSSFCAQLVQYNLSVEIVCCEKHSCC